MVEPLFFDDFVKDGEHFLDTFDEYFRLSFTAAEFKQITSKFGSEKVDPNTKLSQLMKKCFQLFATGFGERFEQIGYHFSDKSGGTLKIAERLKRKEKINVLIGFRVTQLWNNPLTVGPVANDPSAREFRTFWHGDSALRRFADSRVCECMVWGEEPSPAVVKTILRFLLIKNFGLTDEAVAWKSSFYDPTVVKKHNDEINTAFSSLSTALRSLKNLSLSVTNIHGVSPFLRGTEPQCELTKAAIGGKLQEGRYLPTSHLLPKFTPTVEVFIKMAYSTKWGDDVEAIKKLTAAFYLQIAEQLKTSHKLIAVPTEEHLYVVQDEIVFRLIIVNDKLQRLLEGRVNSLKENGASRIKATPEGRAHSSFQKKFVSELQLASSLHSFSLKSSFFSSTVQLFKLWLGAHQMSGILTDFATELLVAAALGCKDKSEPGSSLCAFRRCLKLLAKHSWLSQPLFVDFDSQWTHEELDNLELNFIKMRPVLPPMVIITNEDHLGNKWTKDPSPQMLKRLVALATNSLRIIDEGLTNEAVVDLLGSVTQSTFKNYDLVLSCHRKMVTRAVEMVENGELKGLPVVDFDPVTDLVVALQNSLGSVALFFYNKYGSDKIAVKFKPIGEGVPAKVSRSGDNLTKSREKVHPSREEIIEKIEVMGKSIIRTIEKNF